MRKLKACPNCGSTVQDIGRIEVYNMAGVELNRAEGNDMSVPLIIDESVNWEWDIVYVICVDCGQENEYGELAEVEQPQRAFGRQGD